MNIDKILLNVIQKNKDVVENGCCGLDGTVDTEAVEDNPSVQRGHEERLAVRGSGEDNTNVSKENLIHSLVSRT